MLRRLRRWCRERDSATAEVAVTAVRVGGPIGTAACPTEGSKQVLELASVEMIETLNGKVSSGRGRRNPRSPGRSISIEDRNSKQYDEMLV